MNDCLCCGKPLRSEASEKNGWHSSCVKRFFGTSVLPDIDVSKEVLHQLVLDSTSKGFTVTGVQKKLSLHLTEDEKPRLTLVNYPTGYILKPQTDDYVALPEMEFAVMQMAKASGIATVPFALLKLPSQDNAFSYITKRIDRANGKILAMEDFCQLDGRLTEDKYRGSYERCGKIVNSYSYRARLDISELFLRIVFSFAVGNSDMHLKNFSLIETEEGSSCYQLSAAYDILSTNVVIPADKEQMALTINGKKQNIRRKDFLVLSSTLGLEEKIAVNLIDKIVKLEGRYLDICSCSYMPDDMKGKLRQLIQNRMDILAPNPTADIG